MPASLSTKAFRIANIVFGFFALLICGYLGLYAIVGLMSQSEHTVERIAHRGGKDHNPENTLNAFAFAVQQNVDWLEFDLRMTKDDVVIVSHDAKLDRLAGIDQFIRDLTHFKLRAVKLAGGASIPSFEEVVIFAKENGKKILPEIKNPSMYPGIVAKVVDVIRRHEYADKTVVQSFDWMSLVELQSIAPEMDVCPLGTGTHFDVAKMVPASARYVCLPAEAILLNPWMILHAHQLGKKVYVWFHKTETPMVVGMMRWLGADGIMTDQLLY